MFRIDFKIAIRNLLKNRTFSLLNIFGLTIGTVSCLLIINYIAYENSFDQFHFHKENIYRLTHEFYQNGELKSKSAAAYAPLASAIIAEIPEIKQVARIHPITGTITSGEVTNIKRFNEERIYFTDNDFFKIFSFKIIYGNTNSALEANNSAVITEKAAEKYFEGRVNPIGQEIYWNNGEYEAAFTITGVLENIPKNSHLKFDFLFSLSTLESLDSDNLVPLSENWGWPAFYTYILTLPEVEANIIELKLEALIEKYLSSKLKSWNNGGVKFHTQPLQSIHLHSGFSDELSVNSNATTIQFLSLVAVFVLLIAYINYINLSVSGSMYRAKEIGLRKLMGSKKSQLIRQFLLESLLMNFMAFVLGIIGYYLALPHLYLFTGNSIPNVLWVDATIFRYCITLFFLGALLSGLYPAFILTGFKPIKVLKGSFKHGLKESILRKSLVVFQFIATIAMVTGALVVYKQIDYMRHKDLGFNLDETIIITGPKISAAAVNLTNQNSSFKTSLMRQKEIKNISFSNAVPGTEVNHAMMYKQIGEDWENGQVVRLMNIDITFIDQYEINVIAGRKFEETNSQDVQDKTLLINEAAAFLLGFENLEAALNTKIVSAMGKEREVVGLVRNYHHKSLVQSYEPLLFVINPQVSDYISIKLQANKDKSDTDLKSTINLIEKTYKKHFPDDAFSYFFMGDFFDRQYKASIYFMRLISLFTLLTIFVACLGLFGLSSYDAQQRTKEIGIRKVMGASFLRILALLSVGYIKLLVLAFLIAFPICNYLITEWLKQYAFKIYLNAWFFVIPAFIVFTVTLFAISRQSAKAASLNPARTLRYE